jgi:hypothetical protein
MKPEIWTPHVTVAAIVERDGRFLVIEEHTSAGLRINQPAGHLEAGETLVDAVIRETLEETGCRFEPSALVGVYLAHYDRPASAGATYLRFTFCGRRASRCPATGSTTASCARCGSTPANCAPASTGIVRRRCCAASTTTWPDAGCRSTSCTPIRSRRARTSSG